MAKKDFNKGAKRNASNPKGQKFDKNHKRDNLDRGSERGVSCDYHNDVDWYDPAAGSIDGVASLSFGNSLGRPLAFGAMSSYTGENVYNDVIVPGVSGFKYVNGPGPAGVNSDAVNVSANAFYTDVRSENSRTAAYEPADLFIANLCLSDIYKMLAWGKKAFGWLTKFNWQNSYFPRAFFNISGLDYSDWTANMHTFPAKFAVRLRNLEAYPMYGMIPYFKREIFLASNVWSDGMTDKSQFYTFTPYGYYTFSGTASQEGSCAVYNIINNDAMTMDQYFAIIDEMLAAIINNQDTQVMLADVKHYMSKKSMDTPKYMEAPTLDYQSEILFDPEFLQQIHNMTRVGLPPVDAQNPIANLAVLQDADTGAVVYNPMFTQYNGLQSNALLDLPMANPSSKEVMEATRLMVLGDRDSLVQVSTSGMGYFKPNVFGTDIVVMEEVALTPDSKAIVPPVIEYETGTGALSAPYGSIPAFLRTVQFNYHPGTPVYNDGGAVLNFLHQELDNTTTVSINELRAMNDVALRGVWDVKKS